LSPPEHSVRIEPHGRLLRVTPGHPILEAALGAGLNLPHSCKSGHCGSCRARLLAGEIHYPNGPPLGITAEEVQRGDILLCQARADSDLTVQARLIASVADVEIKTLPCRIARLRPLAPDVMQLWLRLPAVERLRFHPGQYLDVLLESGRRRSFSIANPPHNSELIELHVRRVSGGGFSERLFGAAAAVLSLAVLAATGEAQLMFCNMGSIRVRELVQPGDSGPLASDVTLQGLAVAFPGSYDLVNARVSVNGGIHLVVDAETQVLPNGGRGLEGIAQVYLDRWPGSVGVT